MKLETKEIYSEIYQVLNLLGYEYINKLPDSLFNVLKEKRNLNYNPVYVEDMPLDKQNIRKETISIIVLLYLNYWCENEEEKNELKQILKNNEDKYQNEIRKKYNPDNLFKKQNKNVIQNELAIVNYKESKIKKIINKIKNIFVKEKIYERKQREKN